MDAATIKQQLKESLAYNHWRVLQFASVLNPLDSVLLEKEIPGSFPTFRNLLEHVMYVEHLWQQRVQGVRRATVKLAPFSSFQDITAAWVVSVEHMQQWLESTPAEALLTPITFETDNGSVLTVPPKDMIPHLVDHSSFHGGQVVVALRTLGVKPPATGLLYYHLAQQKAN